MRIVRVSAPDAMSTPIGEDSWVAYTEEAVRHATTLEQRVQVVELFKNAAIAEPESVKVWVAYCDYFWSLYHSCQNGELPGWTREEQIMGRELFCIDNALSLWNQAYDAVKYRLGDSNQLWDRWISLELDQLSRTRTPEGVKRITHLFRNRLTVPHATWDNTSSMFSSFLSEYNKPAWEQTMAEVTTTCQEAKKLYEPRDPYEMRLNKAIKADDLDAHRTILKEYLGWEIAQSRRDHKNRRISLEICKGLFGRALSGIFSTDEGMWNDYLVFLSTMQTESRSAQDKVVSQAQLDAARRSVQHCSWSGPLWARYILTAEEAGLSFAEMEAIKHEATSSQLGRDGMTGIIDMYAAWCGYLKRTAMDPHATEQSIDLAEMGLPAALEDVQLWGKRLYKDAYKGDPNFRLERIYIQYLTEGSGAHEDARNIWIGLASKDLYADSYNFWTHYYIWEMLMFSGNGRNRSPTPTNAPKVARVPTLATNVLARGVNRKTLDWPEKIMEIYLQHCNDYESPTTLRQATDLVHRVQKTVSKRREREQAQAAYAWQAQQAQARSLSSEQAGNSPKDSASPSSSKRKREVSPEGEGSSSKRAKNTESASSTGTQQAPKRDRENTSVLVTNLPADVSQTKIRQYFREYGHINNLTVKQEADGNSSAALIEFRTIEEAQSALLRDSKYFGQSQIGVVPATGLTLFVTNFPPTADDNYIRNLFKDCGDIFSIRWPSLKFNTHRRFVYVSFRDAEASAKAIKLNGSILEGIYKLEVKYSDPAHKKAREGAVAEGRECHVSNLNQESSESDVRELFSKYGSVSSVRILRNMAGRSRGTAFVVFATKDEAEAAAQALDKTKFGKEILNVEVSQQTNFKPVSKTARARSGTPASSHGDVDGDTAMTDGNEPTPADIQNRTVAIMGLTDTVNDARVRALVEPHGELVKLVLRPDHGGAILEFANAAMAGTATLALEGVEVDGHKLRTGTVKDLFKEKGIHDEGQTNTDKPKDKVAMMPPPRIMARRPVLGSRGGKKGLGFAVPKTAAPAHSITKANCPMKSNADFKAMVLSGKQNGGEKSKTEKTTATD